MSSRFSSHPKLNKELLTLYEIYAQVAAIPAVEQVLQEWDIKQTDVLLEKLEADSNTRQEQERKLREAENNRFVD